MVRSEFDCRFVVFYLRHANNLTVNSINYYATTAGQAFMPIVGPKAGG